MLESGSRSNIHEALANYRSGAEMSAPTSRRQTGDGDRPKIHPMPPNPLPLLTKLTAFIKVWVMSPWLACVQHPTALLKPKNVYFDSEASSLHWKSERRNILWRCFSTACYRARGNSCWSRSAGLPACLFEDLEQHDLSLAPLHALLVDLHTS